MLDDSCLNLSGYVPQLDNTPKDETTQYDQGKPDLSMVPHAMLSGLARVYMAGVALGYEKDNWRKGTKWSKGVASLRRHLAKMWDLLEDYDAESGELHIDHIIWRAIQLRYYYFSCPEHDDRPQIAPEVLERMRADYDRAFRGCERKAESDAPV